MKRDHEAAQETHRGRIDERQFLCQALRADRLEHLVERRMMPRHVVQHGLGDHLVHWKDDCKLTEPVNP